MAKPEVVYLVCIIAPCWAQPCATARELGPSASVFMYRAVKYVCSYATNYQIALVHNIVSYTFAQSSVK